MWVASGPQGGACVSFGAFLEISLDLTSEPLISVECGLSCPAVCVLCANYCCCSWIFPPYGFRTSYIICEAPCKIKVWGSLFKNYAKFPEGYNRALNQERDPSEHKVLLKFSVVPTLQRNSRATGLAKRRC